MALKRALSLEQLEDRMAPAVFGTPWPDARHLTLSFVPDRTAVASNGSSLFQTLDAIKPAAQWQDEILRAIQTWAAVANLNVGVVADGGQPFGAPGLVQGDARFGDIRIGAQPMDSLSLAVATPPGSSSGTWAGDILLNSNYDFDGPNTDLYSVMLHEFGHALGLSDSTDPASVMFPSAGAPVSQLSAGDIAAVQALYGKPGAPPITQGEAEDGAIPGVNPGPHAAFLGYSVAPGGYSGATPLIAYGDLNANVSASSFVVRTLPNYVGPVTFRLQTAGISLLEPRLTLLDSKGNPLGQAQSTNLGGDVVQITLDQVAPDTNYTIQVDAAGQNVFDFGHFAVVVSFDQLLQVSPAAVDAVLRGSSLSSGGEDQQSGNPDSVFLNFTPHQLSTFATAQTMLRKHGFGEGSQYAADGSLSDNTDVRYYEIQAPLAEIGETVVLTANITEASPDGDVPRIDLFDAAQNPVQVQVLDNGNGDYTIQAAGVIGLQNYYLRISDNQSSAPAGSNYSLVADFNHHHGGPLSHFGHGTLTTTAPSQTATLYVAASQLFQFALSASSAAGTGSAVQMMLTATNSQMLLSLLSSVGSRATASVFLNPGQYTAQFRAISPDTSMPGPVGFLLLGATLSDPVGPKPNDPTLSTPSPGTSNPGSYLYPNGVVSSQPYYWVGLIF
jgi:hypothetical protein